MEDRLSVIVPVYNEAKILADFFEKLKIFSKETEIIFVDGGSSDNTLEIIKNRGFKFVQGEKGRGRQLNLGINNSSGDNILILHSDTFFKESPEENIKFTLEKYKIGCFSLEFIEKSHGLKMVARNSSRRVKYRNIAFGDQGMFFTRSYFDYIGKFKEIEFMEDYDFSIRVKKNGDRIKLLDQKIYTSGRRFINNGLWKTIITMQKAQSMYRRGKSVEEIREIYRLS